MRLIATLLSWCLLAVPAGQELARSIEIWSEHPIAIDIEWLTIDRDGEADGHREAQDGRGAAGAARIRARR